MSDYMLIDEFHLILRVPADLEQSAWAAIHQILEGQPFRSALRRAIHQVVRHYPDLDSVRIRISR